MGLIAVNEGTTIWSAYAQLQTYKAEIPTLLHYNAALVVSDGLQARMPSHSAPLAMRSLRYGMTFRFSKH